MFNFCTLFDSYYLTRGLALYQSLELYCSKFHLYIFAFDDISFNTLKGLNLKHATIIPLIDFENKDLLRIKSDRTIAEYCWTCTASTIWYSIHTFQLDHCTYLDADILFFASPESIFEEIGSASIAITPHNFSSNYKSSEVYGKYCVQFIFFKNDLCGLEALNWWREVCIEWCYAKLEDGKYGDQKYLDYFESRFSNICVINRIGSGVAPWNISDYTIKLLDNKVIIALKNDTEKIKKLIFYHFQGLKFNDDLKQKEVKVIPAIGNIQKNGLDYIYKPYIEFLLLIKANLKGVNPTQIEIIFQSNKLRTFGLFFRNKLRRYKIIQNIYYKYLKKRYNRPANIGGIIN